MAPADQPHTSATVQSPPPPGIPALISAFTVLLQLHSVELTVARSGIRMQTHVLASCVSVARCRDALALIFCIISRADPSKPLPFLAFNAEILQNFAPFSNTDDRLASECYSKCRL